MLDKRRLNDVLLPLLIGVVSFFILFGFKILCPTNIGWIAHSGDPAQHYLGWLFYRYSDWAFPIGLNPSYGLDIGSSIVYSDSIPFFAIIFKLFSSFLSEPFQYLGMWMLLCIVLQSWFAWKLLGLITKNIYMRIFGVGLFIFSPPMLTRSGFHTALCSHFIILAALYVTLMPKYSQYDRIKRLLWWGGILVTAALVHSYLLVMVGLFCFVDIFSRFVRKERLFREAIIDLSVLFVIAAFACWQAGYFTLGMYDIPAGGYGIYRLNLLSIINPMSWSYVLKDLPGGVGDYEGFNYLGLGVIVLALFSIPALISGRLSLTKHIKGRPFFLIAFMLLTLFAVTYNIGIGSWDFKIPLDKIYVVYGSLSVFRGSGRMFWPVFYMIIFVVVFIIIRTNKERNAIILLAIAFLLQVVDTSAVWSKRRQQVFMYDFSSEWSVPFKDKFWEKVSKKVTVRPTTPIEIS